jgi:D-serine deaminase-like pyridoxal phosphate-dependent protein
MTPDKSAGEVRSMISAWRDHVRKMYGAAIGRSRRDHVTPALIMGLDVVRHNMQHMMQQLSTAKAKLRPHVKCQKRPELARLQIEAGAIGVCTATVWEAIVMSCSGIEDVLIANQVGGREKIAALNRLIIQSHKPSSRLSIPARERSRRSSLGHGSRGPV